MQPIEWAVAGCLGSLVVVVLVVLRIYLGWAYVGDRLLSAAVPYEETGWYVTGDRFLPSCAMFSRFLVKSAAICPLKMSWLT